MGQDTCTIFTFDLDLSYTVARAVFFKIDSLPMISKGKDGYQYGHDMLHDGLEKDTA